jgi:hypothetical protein
VKCYGFRDGEENGKMKNWRGKRVKCYGFRDGDENDKMKKLGFER